MKANRTATQKLLLHEPENIVRAFFKDKDGNPLQLAHYQADFVSSVLRRKNDRFIYVAATQSGKSEAIASLIALFAILCPNERIVNISYTDAQARIIFERAKAHLAENNPEIRKLVDVDRSFGSKKEFSKTRMFMKNGTDIRVMSTGTGTTETVGEGLLGFEATLLIVDEAGSISDEVFLTKIMRMVGATRSVGLPKIVVLSGTPHTINHFADSWEDARYTKFHVGWKKAVAAGRLSEKFVKEQKSKMTSFEFDCWYEALFPTMTEDSMFDMKEIERNIVTEDPQFYGTKILSVDVARFGVDKTVYTMLDYIDDVYRITDIIANEQKTTMQVSGRIISLHNMHHFDRINVDEGGLGSGVVDRLHELNIEATGVIAGRKCTTPEIAKTCLNLKAELYAEAKRRFEQNTLKIIGRAELKHELRQMKRDYKSTGKLIIVDPPKSPDFADSLVYALYKPDTGTFIVLDRNKGEGKGPFWPKV